MDKNLLQKAKAHMIALINPQALKGRPDHNHGCNPWSVTQAQHGCNPWTVTQAQHRCNPWTVTPRTLLLLLLAIATAAQAQFGGGTGASYNPYRIATTNHLLELAASVNSGNQHEGDHFILLNDLDFTGIDYTPIGGGIINNDYAVFSGTFNGLGHKILNLRVGCSYHAGIFGQISSGTIEHLTLGGDSRIEGGFCVGGIVGRTGTSNIIDCHVEKTVTIAASKRGSEYIGGIVGAAIDGTSYVAQEIEGCTSAATVTNNGYSNVKYVGGIAGVILSDGQSIRNCKNYGAVSGSSDVGGIVGEFNFNWPGNVLEDCYTGGNCTLYGVGQPGSSQGINLEGKAVSMHTITFGDNVQGNVTTTPTATFEGENFYAAGMQVSLNIIPDSGTPVGYLPMFYLNAEPKQTGYEIETVMPAENVTVTVDATNLMRDISYSQWVSVSLNQESFDYDGSEQVPEVTVTDIKNGTPVTLVEGTHYEVMPPSNPISPGNYTLTINGIGQFGGKVRVLYAITTPDRWPGLGTADKPYLILTTDHILALADSVNNGKSYIGQYFSLQNDLDFSSKDYVPIGNFNNEFKGTFNGNGHSFNHVVINNDKDYLGLFGNIGEDGSVSGLTLGEGSSIEGRDYIGGIAALCRGTISDCSTAEGVIVKASSLSAGGIAYSLLGGRIANCQNHADVSTKSICGGIAGNNENGEVSGCINYGSVEAGTWIAGGIVGEITQHGIVRDCFNEGTVSSPQNVGGIVGDLGGIIRNCLNLGAVSASNNKNVGGIAGRKTGSLSLSNNYYAGACSVGGINGSDGKGEAMRGYTVSGESGITLGLQGSSGVSYKGDIYAGKGELILIDISVPEGYTPLNGYSASAGTLTPNGTAWRLTMPNEDVVITADLGLALTVPGYGESTSAGWRFIASPVVGSVAATEVVNLFAATEYDLYRFNQSATLEWENYKQEGGDHYQFDIENGQGYLYASEDDVTLVFGGTYNTSTEPVEVPLVYDPNASFAGWNLVGNPFPVAAYANRSYYVMNADGTGIEPNAVSSATAIPACTGVMVKADGANESVTFSRASQQSAPSQGSIQIAVAQANTRGNAVEDKAIVSFNEADQLGKFVFNEANAKLYIPQGGKDYAIAVVGREASWHVSTTDVPINFKAAKNGTYTLTVNVENMDLDYLHLIDNMTGADVDLLATKVPELVEGPTQYDGVSTGSTTCYTFTAKTTDYASRFRLVFSNDDAGDGEPDAPFAYISDGNIIVNGEGTLQVMDMTGRVIRSTDVARNVSTNGIPAGVYVLRLIGGDTIRTQKIVID